MRVIFVILVFFGLGGAILYLLLWVLIPDQPNAEEQATIDHIIDQEIDS